jgi:hypothetical protein|tara:strand:+ start:1499 stop:2662 length:1164 start_codon:yes stop_codon:yes gene_type:complete
MAVYKLFSEQDAFIRSQYPAQNTGRDEILEISNINGINQLSSAEGDLPAVNRALIQFDNSDLNNIITNTVATSSYQVSLRLYLANAGNLPLDYTIQAYPVSQSWDMGTGRVADDPKTDNGCSWTFAGESGSNRWTTTGFSNYVTASFGSTVGGSTWYTGSTETFEGDLLDPESGQVFDYTSNKDINMFVTDTVRLWLTGSGGIVNNGFVVKLDDTVEFGTNFVSTNFFSMDTHTIYPPALEIKWDDSMVDNYFITGSGTGSIVTSSAFISKFTNLQSTFEDSMIYNFEVKTRDTFPARSFQTQSVYLNTKLLPTSSYWAIKDAKTGEMVVDFDSNFTKLSMNSGSNYFKVYMDGLEPERYYQLMVQTIVGDETIVVDSGTDYFKIVR